MSHTQKITLTLVALLGFVLMPHAASAFSVEALDNDVVVGDFVVGPGKLEVELDPGQTKVVEITVTNRTGEEQEFTLNIEDFLGTRNVQQTVMLLGEKDSPYSLRHNVQLERDTFTLQHAERARLFASVTAPVDAEPGGRYGSVLVSIVSDSGENSGSSAPIISRLGALFFVRISGDVVEEGQMNDFTVSPGSVIFNGGPVTFNLLFENNGSVHLSPYGGIGITNMLGEVVGETEVEPWFVLPDALRLREIAWDRPLLIGRYTATAQINRGYEDIVDEATVSFWVIPWKLILLVLVAIIVLFLLVHFVRSKIEIRVKQTETPES